jgi:hypothetical protein
MRRNVSREQNSGRAFTVVAGWLSAAVSGCARGSRILFAWQAVT